MPVKKTPRIVVPKLNLYPQDPFYETLLGKGLKWAVSVGRHIIIFTEIIVIGSFASRFVLDRQLSDLNSSILQKQAIVESYGTLEADIRAIQKKTVDVQSILGEQGKMDVLDLLTRITPTDIEYQQISYFNDRILLQGKAQSNRGLSQLLSGLQSDPKVARVNVSEIQSGDERDPALTFSVSADYVHGGTLGKVIEE